MESRVSVQLLGCTTGEVTVFGILEELEGVVRCQVILFYHVAIKLDLLRMAAVYETVLIE